MSSATASASRSPDEHDSSRLATSVTSPTAHVGTGVDFLCALAANKWQADARPQQAEQPQRHGCAGAAADGSQKLGVDDGGVAAKRTKEQEKNRRAQARFRERQKAKHGETERRMHELEVAVKQLQIERDALAVKADTLERCLLQGDPTTGVGGATDVGDAEAKAACFREYVEWYKGQVQQLAPLLVQAQFDMHSDAGKKIADIWGSLVKTGVKWYRDESIRMRVYSRAVLHDEEPQPPRPDKHLWKQVTAALQLSDAQLATCREVRTAYLLKMAAIMTERQALNWLMQDMPDCNANAKVALHTAKALDAIEKLRTNLKQEQTLQSELAITVFDKVLTPIQAATAFVGLYPWAPDKLAILDCACSCKA